MPCTAVLNGEKNFQSFMHGVYSAWYGKGSDTINFLMAQLSETNKRRRAAAPVVLAQFALKTILSAVFSYAQHRGRWKVSTRKGEGRNEVFLKFLRSIVMQLAVLVLGSDDDDDEYGSIPIVPRAHGCPCMDCLGYSVDDITK